MHFLNLLQAIFLEIVSKSAPEIKKVCPSMFEIEFQKFLRSKTLEFALLSIAVIKNGGRRGG